MVDFEETGHKRVVGYDCKVKVKKCSKLCQSQWDFQWCFPGQGRIASGLTVKFFVIYESAGALSRQIRTRWPEELLYADDLALISEIFDDLKGRLLRSLERRTGIKRVDSKC